MRVIKELQKKVEAKYPNKVTEIMNNIKSWFEDEENTELLPKSITIIDEYLNEYAEKRFD